LDSDLEKAIKQLVEKAASIDVEISATEAVKLTQFVSDLIAYNAHTNLVGSAEPGEIVINHVLDSLSLLPIIKNRLKKQSPLRLIDIGTGAGFPGIVLALMLEQVVLTLVDATQKKTRFVKQEVKTLRLSNVEVITARAEDLAHQSSQRDKYDFATGRALGCADMLMELALPFLALGGLLLVQKSQAQKEAELRNIRACTWTLGAKLEHCIDLDEGIFAKARVIIVVSKNSPTDSTYPRQWSKIKAQPLSYKGAPSVSETNQPSADA